MSSRPVLLTLTLGAIIGAVYLLEMVKGPPVVTVGGMDEIPANIVLENQSGIPALTCSDGKCTSTKEIPEGESAEKSDVTLNADPHLERVSGKAAKFERAKEISTPDGFINLADGKSALALSELVGKKVILIDFWTYSCINCQRTTPYLNAWYEKYRDQGLEIVGIHTPEFQFEHKYENVLAATKKFGIEFPVVLDNDYSTWTAYENRYWPRKYLIDIDGFIVYDHIGEGAYEETEGKIQEALKERIAVLNLGGSVAGGMVNPKAVDKSEVAGAISPEIYFGSLRNTLLGNGRPGISGPQTFTEPQNALSNVLYLDGAWTIASEYAENTSAPAKIVFRYQAKHVYMVARANSEVRIRVLRDGVPVGVLGGADVSNENGVSVLRVKDDQLYHLVSESGREEHTLELIIENPGFQAFTFTFG